MSEETNKPAKNEESTAIDSLVLDLNFVPAWARQPPSPDPYLNRATTERTETDKRRGERSRDSRRGEGPRFDRRPGPGGRPGRGPRRDAGSSQDRSGRRHSGSRDPRMERGTGGPVARGHREREPFLPVQVSFLPEQDRLAAMVADIRTSQHAYPLPELAHTFLARPEWHLVKIESNKRSGGAYMMELFQCKSDGQIYLSREEAIREAAARALTESFVSESVQQDPPAGNFVCVARCGLSGELLGPPNHHAFKEAVEEMHRTRFSHLPLDDYRRQVETVRDPELVEQWKENWRTKTVYRRKPTGESESPGEPLDLSAVREMCQQEIAPKQVSTVRRVVIPGTLSRELKEVRLTRTLRAAWGREQRFPATLVRALKGAFRRMGLHLFETKDGAVFVTAVKPHPVDSDRVIEVIREILVWLKEHPGCSRSDLIAGIRPALGEDPAKLGEVLQPLTWLVEKGHVIEFHNGTLAVPKDTPT